MGQAEQGAASEGAEQVLAPGCASHTSEAAVVQASEGNDLLGG
jgi:hypothetical protein